MKRTFLAGLVILMPLVLTVLVLTFLVDLLTDPFLNIVKDVITEKLKWIHSQKLVTLLARTSILVLIFFFIMLLGFFGRLFFIKWALSITNKVISKIPLIKPIYMTSKDIVQAFFQKDSQAFRNPVMVSFPSKKSFTVGFATGRVPNVCQKHFEKKLTPVFVPTAPHPISGFILFTEEDKQLKIDMTNEEAVKLTVSCGVIIPERKE